MFEICSTLTIKAVEDFKLGVFIVDFEHTLLVVIVFLFLTLNKLPLRKTKCTYLDHSLTTF